MLLPGLCSVFSVGFFRIHGPPYDCEWTRDEITCGFTQDPGNLVVGLLIGAVGVALITWAIALAIWHARRR
jgi:hypothetical protein